MKIIPKIILITGAGTGIGKLTALTLGKIGHQVIATTETEEQAQLLKEDAQALKIPLTVEKVDITKAEDRKEAWKWDIDILVNNAAVKEGGALVDIPEDNLRHQMEVNYFATILITQGFARKMIDQGYGRIIFISSVSGLVANALSGPYTSSKFAIEAAADALSQELQEFNIEVATVNPSMYLTGFNDEEFEKYRTWQDNPEDRVYNYPELNFPFPQMDPQKLIPPTIRVILGETKLYRNVIPRTHALGAIGKQAFQWIKHSNWNLGKRHAIVKMSDKIQPATKM